LGFADDWEGFVGTVAVELVSALMRRLYNFHLGRIRVLDGEKPLSVVNDV